MLFPYKQVIALLRIAQTRYIFPTLLMPIFKFFLKSKNLKSLIISPKSHSTVTLTELISALYPSITGVSHDEMVPVGAHVKGKQGHQTHTWALQLGKMHFAQAHEEGWSPPAY